VFSADTVDSDLLGPLCNYLDKKMNAGENILINCISKSGHTTETIANFEILLDLLARHNKKYEQSIVVTTAKDSPLYELSMKKKFQVLEIPKKVGGRFSVFSPVGLFPLGLIGVNIDELLEGARVMRQRCLSENIFDNPAALSAAYLYLHKKKGNTIHNLFLFDPDLESIGRWYRQLMGESIGKEFNTENKQVFEGITPTVSIGTTDLHSTGQLYLGGPFDKFTTFVRVLQTQSKVAIPMLPDYDELVKGIQGKSLGDLMHAVLDGVQSVYRTQKRPFVEIRLPDKSAFSIGQLLQMKMMEIMYLGALFGVNPFNQPNVELYKQETRRILDQ
jgi:glucose-6-phosphate isomerase